MTARAQVISTVVRVSGPPDVIELGERRTLKTDLGARLRMEIAPPDDEGRGGGPYLIRFFRELH